MATLVPRSAAILPGRDPLACGALVVGVFLCVAPALGCAGGSTQQGGDGGAGPEAYGTAMQHADAAYKEGDYDEAALAYEAALKARPDDPGAVTGLGTCELKTHQVVKAQEMLRDHLTRHPDNVAARLVLARALLRQADLPAAAAELNKVLQSDPDNLMAHYNLGFIDYRERDFPGALTHLKRTIELRPDHPEAHYTLGLTYLAMEKYEDAVAELERAIAIDPKHVGAHFNLAGAAARAGRMDLAAREQKAYAEISGRSKADAERSAQVKAQSLKAVQFLMAQQYPEALREYQVLLKDNLDYAPLYNDIGRVQLKLGQRQEALESLRKAVELDPKLSEPHYLLSNLYHDMGDDASSTRERATFAALETIPEGKSGY
jgi:tetratricopeptide (TPR) repeat protein